MRQSDEELSTPVKLLLGDRYRETLTPLRSPPLQDLPALVCLHSLAKPMGSLASDVGGLIGPLAHERVSFGLSRFAYG